MLINNLYIIKDYNPGPISRQASLIEQTHANNRRGENRRGRFRPLSNLPATTSYLYRCERILRGVSGEFSTATATATTAHTTDDNTGDDINNDRNESSATTSQYSNSPRTCVSHSRSRQSTKRHSICHSKCHNPAAKRATTTGYSWWKSGGYERSISRTSCLNDAF